MPHEVTSIELDTIFTKSEDNPNQQREYNYVLRIDTIDPETGAQRFAGEYRTVASDVPLNLDDVKDRMTELIEKEYD